jgi:hypothetical protein
MCFGSSNESSASLVATVIPIRYLKFSESSKWKDAFHCSRSRFYVMHKKTVGRTPER